MNIGISDHLPCSLCTDINTNKLDAPVKITSRNFDEKVNVAIKCAIYNTDWIFIDNQDNALNVITNLYMGKLKNIIDYHAPERTKMNT